MTLLPDLNSQFGNLSVLTTIEPKTSDIEDFRESREDFWRSKFSHGSPYAIYTLNGWEIILYSKGPKTQIVNDIPLSLSATIRTIVHPRRIFCEMKGKGVNIRLFFPKLMIPRIIGANRSLERPHRHGPATESARLAPKCIASRPASTDMQDSGVDGPHTTGMHRTSYRLHTPSPGAPTPWLRHALLLLLSPFSLLITWSIFLSPRPSAVIFLFFSRPSSYHLPVTTRDVLMASTGHLGYQARISCHFAGAWVFDRILATIDRRSRSTERNAWRESF